ncbi:hypothetical protein VMCG_04363 [Cytospora schulzeri]|uniref:Required for respiratory growth protein 9, mitochondrial n=1 Tax=Cytospora schulzeri TaxID=448051 RepID=A0A423WSF6_9PEZI|nr:hypothetical protein VMCG_04363 [Valsa malicola]
MFVRSLTEVYTPPNNAFARTAWHDTRSQVPIHHTTRLGVSCRQLHASARARSSTQAETAETVSSEATTQQASRGEENSAQQTEDDILFEIQLRSKNARKKARKYGNATASGPVTGEQEAQGTQETHETQKFQVTGEQKIQGTRQTQEAPETHEVQRTQEGRETQETLETRGAQKTQEGREAQEEVQEVQEKKFVGVTRITVDETRGSKHSERGAYFEGRDKPKQTNREPILEEEKKKDYRPTWAIQKEALKAKFPEGWMPRKKLSPDALSGIRALNQQYPEIYTTKALSEKFEVSPEAIRRILRSKWEPADDREEDRQRRWFNRGLRVWERYAELGKTPPRRWQNAGVQARPWNGRRLEEDEEEMEEEDKEHSVNEERLRRLRTQVKLAKSLM